MYVYIGQLRLVYYSGASGCTGPSSSYQFDSRVCYSASSPYTSAYTSTASNTAATDATTTTTSGDLGNALSDGVQVPLKVVKLLRTIAIHNAKQRIVDATSTSSGSAASTTTTATTATTTDYSHTTHTLATTPTAAPTVPASDDDVNYYDDDTNNRHYSYEYYTPGDDDANIYAHDDAAYYSYDVLPAPPSIVSTAFPTTVREGNKQYTARLMCAQPPSAQQRTLTVKQVCILYCIVYRYSVANIVYTIDSLLYINCIVLYCRVCHCPQSLTTLLIRRCAINQSARQ